MPWVLPGSFYCILLLMLKKRQGPCIYIYVYHCFWVIAAIPHTLRMGGIVSGSVDLTSLKSYLLFRTTAKMFSCL